MTAQLRDTPVPVARAAMLDFCGDVLQVEIAGDDMATLRAAMDAHFPHSDAIIARDAIRVPDVFVSDMDSTMIGQECIDELADFAGLKPQIAAITERAMQGELDFESALRERVGLLEGLEEDAIERCLAERIRPTEGARALVETLKSRGCRTVLVTGGFHHFADPVADQLGFERVVGNRLEVSGGKLTGGLVGGITDSGTKRAVLEEEMGKRADTAVSMAAGDGANDIPMLEASTYGIAYRAKLKARAAANGWVERGDLTSLLKLLEIPEKDWVTG
ncbi:phosphoserine phosphatase SerB [Aurantiacibacter aquimixticola]|uniref:Phosphoserine phosphatase n=2 Tax=Aurantiacibacter aquimixticola TaxID=1958945 RepID=A0A419RRG5_9SPHN|nr:phosphoserine phosphatase SerB [Aurantiacibacter aquimixticola]RJY08393.1 phosphoserine phosphatase SerB [Aurantiacibacter aquimixticola]